MLAGSGIAAFLPTEAACLRLGERASQAVSLAQARDHAANQGSAIMIRGGLFIIVGLVMPITAHAAGQQYKTSEQLWKLSDKCTADALKKYPDYTQESLQKREQHIKQC